jgi:hypothetical protein
LPIIVKANDDLRQEEAVSQMIRQFDRILRDTDAGVWLKPYEVCAVMMLFCYIHCELVSSVVLYVHCVGVYVIAVNFNKLVLLFSHCKMLNS